MKDRHVANGKSKRGQNVLYNALAFIVAGLYGSVLASFPVRIFNDRINYLEYAGHSSEILQRFIAEGPVAVLTNEPVWLLINILLGLLFSPETTVRLIVGVPAFIVSYCVLRVAPKHFFWLLLFLFFPQVIKNHIVHLRQGVAISIFLMGWFSRTPFIRYTSFCVAPLVHSSFFFVIGLHLLMQLAMRLRLSFSIRILAAWGAGIVVGLGLAAVASVLGARQASQYDFAMGNVSGLGFLAWGAILMILCLGGKYFRRRHALALGIVSFYLATYFLLEVTARIFESAVLLVLIAGLELSGRNRMLFLGAVLAFFVLSIAQRLQQPLLGFAGGA